ncbi:MAG: NADH-quinone oxidoreductase, chain, partial [Solirubrobacterales bacterium]|nr:NADH-quinone oxidoreductase, chain [Solirubrobacterales bacterium]
EAAAGLARAGADTGAIAGAGSTNEEGLLLSRLLREGLGAPHLDSRRAGSLPLSLHRALNEPQLQAKVSDLEFAHAVLVLDAEPVNDAPILDLRLRKGVRRHRLQLAVASPHASLLDANAALSVRYAPGAGALFAAALGAELRHDPTSEQLAREAGAEPEAVRALAAVLRGAGSPRDGAPGDGEAPAREIVIVWGERLTAGPNAAAGAIALLALADSLGMAGADGAGLLEVPAFANGRGLREAGVLPNAGPGLSEPSTATGAVGGATTGAVTGDTPARDARAIAEGLATGELSALYLLHGDPLRDLPDRELWERALAGASTVVAHASFLTDAIREHATVVFTAETYAEKEGTIVNPDGRHQRLRPAIARPGEVRAEWQVLAELALRLGHDLDVLSAAMASQRLFDAVPFYAGITLDEVGGRGVRWQERAAAAAFPPPATAQAPEGPSTALVQPPADAADLAGWRSVWDAPEVEHSPALEFLSPRGANGRATSPVLPLTLAGGERA